MWFEQKNQLHQPNLDKFMEKLYDYLPQQLVTFILVTLFSLLIGLSQRRISLRREGETTLFGTDRTFTFIGILGYLLYILDPKEMHLFMGGGIILGMLLGLSLIHISEPTRPYWSDNNHHRSYHLLYGSYHKYTAFLVLCHDGSHRASFHRNETHLYRTCTTDAK